MQCTGKIGVIVYMIKWKNVPKDKFNMFPKTNSIKVLVLACTISSARFFIIFFGSCIGRTARQIRTNDGSKRVVPRKDAPLGGLNNFPLNFGGRQQTKVRNERASISRL